VVTYPDRVVILTRALAAASTGSLGERVESWPDPAAGTGEHWCRIESPGGGEQPTAVRQSTAALRLRFRHVVALAAVDRVRVKETEDVYAVVGVWRERAEHGGWVTVCDLSGTY
jgi:hypothetical protein